MLFLPIWRKKAFRGGKALRAAQRDGALSADANVVPVEAREDVTQLRLRDGEDEESLKGPRSPR
ncbi:hypothetical protein AM571_PB00208 (plasmid) [Rhizobium etli 8C-3]|uniref:Uncharacterized protein n=1 Tax=Rhizobium etli 8C-3 TaxID=538025 RepID=A0A1L5PBJ5_RHIET|nr:hypothetical protein AM571_PB00208 [Rhizobium etli 8C-3]ARO26843.1 hypothetical protein TAL182_PC00236 [Rhizobium sp. TAL182]ARQ60715.1 hypothetical protein Kim5_PA00245 [Rhizobium sp. Kim5]EGE57753.1 hypothetical protein RHECNPAF_4050017 [Rhizobium etli CNPAF512]